ncbi:MAG: hypothetical protein HYV08_05200 [Deltaproteobacteria bacterium]|nr:hypothetical protein [Deltaproteobacteria bacterium]
MSVLQLAQLSDAVYSLNRGVFKTSGSYGLRHTVVDAKSGFQAGAFELKNGAVVIAFAGTQLRDPMDLLADVGIARGDLTVLGRWVLEQVRARLPESERARLPRPTAGLLPGDQNRPEGPGLSGPELL